MAVSRAKTARRKPQPIPEPEPDVVIEQVPSLNELGILNGSDKSSLGHGFLRHYDRLFRDLRAQPINILELGVGGGATLRRWAAYFPRAIVVGTDPNPDSRWHAGDRRIVETGSQTDAQFLHRIGSLYRPTIVIDNGTHRADDIVQTFEHLYPTMRHGGLYVVECLHFHAGGGADHWRGGGTAPPQDFFLILARLAGCPESDVPFDRTLSNLTDSVEFFYGGVVIKRRPDWAASDPIALHRPLVARANHARMWINYAQLVLNNGGDPQEAVDACRNALVQEPTEASYHHQLSVALERAGDMEGAMTACRISIRLHPAFRMFSDRLAGLGKKRTETPAAESVGDG